jgi:hypothetical protein
MGLKYIKSKQKKLEKKWRLEEELRLKEEEARIAKMEAEAREREERAYQKRRLLEKQENERLRLKRVEEKKVIAEKKWVNQRDTLVTQVKERIRINNALEEIRVIVQNRDPSLQALDWDDWLLSDPLNQRLAELDLEIAMALFKRDNLLAKRRHGTRGKKAASKPFVLTFAGSSATDYVSTIFNPDDYDGTGTGLNHGFTISYWVKPAQIGGTLKALGRRSETDGRWEFGIKNASDVHVGVGATVKQDNNRNAGVEGGTTTNTGHGMTVGNWYHWVVTYGGDDGAGIGGDRYVRIWINGKEIYKDGAASGTGNENGMGTANWRNDDTNTVNAASNLYFGARAAFQDLDTPYNQGWACSLSEVAIYNVEKDEDGTFANAVYNAGFGYNHKNNSNLVGYWRLNEGSGTTVEDLSGNGNHGTLTTEGSAIPTWTRNSSYE